jgi:hypothetical protein
MIMNYGSFLSALASEINELSARKLFTRGWILDGNWNKNSWLHARVLGALARSVPRPWVPMMEVKWHRWFRPDLCIVGETDSTVAVVEYESTNSSDERMFGKDLRHFETAICAYLNQSKLLPKWWMLISTLPNCQVRNNYYYDWTGCGFPPPEKSKKLRNENPLTYYEPYLHDWLDALWQRLLDVFGGRLPTQIIWANLDEHAIKVMNLNGSNSVPGLVYELHLSD